MFLVYNGTDWVSSDLTLVWDGTEWKHRPSHYFDGLEWQTDAILTDTYRMTSTTMWNVSGPSVPPAPPTQTYTATKSFAATWGASYRADGSKRTDTDDLFQGLSSSGSYNGNQESLCGFSVSGIPAGATIISATLTAYATHWYSNGGGTAIIGTHTYSSEPGSSPSTTEDRLRYTWNTKTGSRTISLGTTIGGQLLSGTAKGICFGPGPSGSTAYYGSFAGTGSYRPSITLKYQWVA